MAEAVIKIVGQDETAAAFASANAKMRGLSDSASFDGANKSTDEFTDKLRGAYNANQKLGSGIEETARKGANNFAILAHAAVIVVAAIMAIDRAFKAADEAAVRLGRTDINEKYERMNASLQVGIDSILESTGLLDAMGVEWERIGQSAIDFATIAINGMSGVESGILSSERAVGKLGDGFNNALLEIIKGFETVADMTKNPLMQGGLWGSADFADWAKGFENTAKSVGAMTEAEYEAAQAAIKLKTANELSKLSYDSITAATETAKKASEEAAKAAKDAAKKQHDDAEKAYADKVSKAAGAAQTLLGIAETYQQKLYDINHKGQKDIEDAIRNGDAKALMDARKARAEALEQAQKDKEKSLQDLAVSFRPAGTFQDVEKTAGALGYGQEFSALKSEYNRDYSGLAGSQLGGAIPAPEVNTQVNVYIDGEELKGVTRTVIAEEVVAPRTLTPTSSGFAPKKPKPVGVKPVAKTGKQALSKANRSAQK